MLDVYARSKECEPVSVRNDREVKEGERRALWTRETWREEEEVFDALRVTSINEE